MAYDLNRIIRDIMENSVKAGEENGGVFILYKDGKKILEQSAGYADVKKKIPFTNDTICRIYSCTKVFTSLCSMILMSRGKLDTFWEVSRFFPEYADAYYMRNWKKTGCRQVMIRDLLNMTSGLAYPGDAHEGSMQTTEVWGRLDESIKNKKCMSTQEFARELGKVPLMFEPGTEWMYGSSADVLGAVIEKITDMELADFMKKEIFDPLGMTDTDFYVPADKRDRLSVLYENAGEDPKTPDWVNLCIYDFEERPAFQSGGAGLFSTPEDMAKFAGELSSGNAGIVNKHMTDFMRTNGLDEKQRIAYNWDSCKGYGYGNLLRIHENRNISGSFAPVGAFGWDGWTGPYYLIDPDNRTGITLCLQRCGAGSCQLSRSLVNAVYGGMEDTAVTRISVPVFSQ
ncbi:MAG: beta-lactamase family protein [Lachnospiraceae bacterium]|nr:beta-lactamase family protein [Lachnospiraceae bacterium]